MDEGRTRVVEITEEWLAEHGYDGLANSDLECGCFIGDLMPCDDACSQCEAGHAVEGKDEDGDVTLLVAPGRKPKKGGS